MTPPTTYLSQHSMPRPRGEGMIDSPPRGVPPGPGHRHWSTALDHTITEAQEQLPTSLPSALNRVRRAAPRSRTCGRFVVDPPAQSLTPAP